MSLRRNTLWNLFGTGLPFLIAAITIPYLIQKIGVEAFGVLTLVWALIGYFSLFDFGLGRALTQQVTAALSAGFEELLPSVVKTGLWFTAATGTVGGIILAISANPLALNWLSVSAPLQSTTAQALLIAAIGIPLTTVTTGLRGILEAYEDFKVVNILRIVLGIANFGLPALSVMFVNDSLVYMVESLIAARLVVLILHVWLVNRRLPINWLAAQVTKDNGRNLLSFGVWMTVSNIISPLMVSADRFVIAAVFGAGAVAYYTVPFEALIRVLVIPASLTSALFPRLIAVMTTNQDEARRLYRRCLTVVTATLIPICLVIGFGSHWGMTLWLGKDFADHSWAIVSVMSVGLLVTGIANVPFTAIHAAGDARTTAYIHLFELVVYLPMLFFCMKNFGLIGAAMAWNFRVAMDLVLLLIYAKKKNL